MDLDQLRSLFQLLDEQDIAEFELEEDNLKLRIRKAAAPQPALPPAVAPTVPAASPTAALAHALAPALPSLPPSGGEVPAGVGAPAEEAGLHIVKSPIVGTFYRSPDPTSPAFVNVGDKVRVGQVLCIIEAMKLMNEIEAEVAGEIVKIHRDSAQPVQYGEPLFSVRPDR